MYSDIVTSDRGPWTSNMGGMSVFCPGQGTYCLFINSVCNKVTKKDEKENTKLSFCLVTHIWGNV